jgi:cellobiose phosphorylase
MAHPAFAKLFLETEYDKTTSAIIVHRRPRDAKEKPIWGVHVSASSHGSDQAVEYETDRAKFLGRGRTAANPTIFDEHAALSGTSGAVLDPILCLQRRVQLEPGESARLAFATGAGENRKAVQAIAGQFSSIDAVDRAFSDASDRYRAELQELQLTPDDVSLFNRLIGSIAFANPNTRQAMDFKNKSFDRSVLWSCGISGDLPILMAHIGIGDEPLIREILLGHDFSRGRRVRFDLVLFDERGSSSASHLVEELKASSRAEFVDKPGGIFVLSSATASGDDIATISAAARVVLLSKTGSLAAQLDRQNLASSLPPELAAPQKSEPIKSPTSSRVKDLLFWNGLCDD